MGNRQTLRAVVVSTDIREVSVSTWRAFTLLSDSEESFVVSPAVLHTRTISIHPPASQAVIPQPGSRLLCCTPRHGKPQRRLHGASHGCPQDRRGPCKQGCLQEVQDPLSWVVTSARQSARTTVFRRNPQLLSAARVGETCSGSNGEGALVGRELLSCGVCSQSPGCTRHLREERGGWWQDGTRVCQGTRCESGVG